MKKTILLLGGCIAAFMGLANNINVSSASITTQNTTTHSSVINFSVSWENSWRTSTNESNYDGAWIFIKFRKQGTQDWRHCTIAGTGFTPATGGAISVAGDGKGIFLYRSANGIGNVSYAGNNITWNYGTDGVLDNDNVEIRVFALEMVYVPTGSFYAGTGGIETSHFKDGATNNPFLINSAGPIATGTTNGQLNFNGNGSGSSLPASFPNGYGAFWVMKYECSQQQYADLLNHLDFARATVLNTYTPAFTGAHPAWIPVAPERAMTQVGFRANAALADWSGLRPMSELEFEKACRGFNINPVPNEFAWGSTSIIAVNSVNDPGLATESVNLPANANAAINGTYVQVNRTGLFARPSGSTRQLSGGTYYGAMNFTDNVAEIVINAGSPAGQSITNTIHGDGYLGADAYTDITLWQNSTAFGMRGSSYNGSQDNGRVSDRTNVAYFSSFPSDINTIGNGIRLVRTAP